MGCGASSAELAAQRGANGSLKDRRRFARVLIPATMERDGRTPHSYAAATCQPEDDAPLVRPRYRFTGNGSHSYVVATPGFVERSSPPLPTHQQRPLLCGPQGFAAAKAAAPAPPMTPPRMSPAVQVGGSPARGPVYYTPLRTAVAPGPAAGAAVYPAANPWARPTFQHSYPPHPPHPPHPPQQPRMLPMPHMPPISPAPSPMRRPPSYDHYPANNAYCNSLNTPRAGDKYARTTSSSFGQPVMIMP